MTELRQDQEHRTNSGPLLKSPVCLSGQQAPSDIDASKPLGSLGPVALALRVSVVLAIAFAIVLRFWTRSDLWLDEALTVNIAHLPVSQIPAALRRDGAPPLFYILLHYWMDIFGTSDVAVRSLAGVFGVITLPVAWLCGRHIGGRVVAWGAVLLLAVSPFAVYYDTEVRMYSLVVLLTGLGYLALRRVLIRPTVYNMIAVALVSSALLYTHYWALYLLGVVGLWLIYEAFITGRIWNGRGTDNFASSSGDPEDNSVGSPENTVIKPKNAMAAIVAIIVGALTFIPWLPIFIFQAHHTGTPWIHPAGPQILVHVLGVMGGGGSFGGRLLFIIITILAFLALFGVATSRYHIDLDIRTRPRGRAIAVIIAGTLLAGLIGGYISNSGFVSRYASVVFLPIVLLSAAGLLALADTRVRSTVMALAVVGGFAASVPNITTNRTQAGEVAGILAREGKPGDVVAYCPDQLGPAVNRLLPTSRYQQITFPRGTGPEFVNWINYTQVVKAANPTVFAHHLYELSHGRSQIWVVWAPGYLPFGDKCQEIIQYLQDSPQLVWKQVLTTGPFFEGMGLFRFTSKPATG